MKKILGIIIAILGIAGGIYVGVFLMLVGGIFQIIEACKNNWETAGIVFGVIKIMFCEAGGIIAWLGIAIGSYLGLKD